MAVMEPLPKWARALVAAIGLMALGVIGWLILDDGLGKAQPADWRIANSVELGPNTRQIPIVVNETECASGRSAKGRIESEVTYSSGAVQFEVGVRTLGGDQDCQSNPDTPFTVELDEPLGDRTVIGEHWPAP